KGRDWSCFKKMVSITALSAVGAAFSVGAAAVWAPAPELNARTPASAAIAVSETIPRPIAISLVLNTRFAGLSRKRDHCRLARIAQKWIPVLRIECAQKMLARVGTCSHRDRYSPEMSLPV